MYLTVYISSFSSRYLFNSIVQIDCIRLMCLITVNVKQVRAWLLLYIPHPIVYVAFYNYTCYRISKVIIVFIKLRSMFYYWNIRRIHTILCYILQGGIYLVQLLDTYGAPISILFIVCVEAIAVSWIYGMACSCQTIVLFYIC